MAYKVILGENQIELPNCYTLQERIDFCKKVIEENESFFIYELPNRASKSNGTNASEKTKTRLRIMGEYIYDASSSGVNDTVITQWRNKRNINNEVMFSELERKN